MNYFSIRNIVYSLTALLIIAVFVVAYWSISPKNFTSETVVSIKPNTSLSGAADQLESSGVIKSSFMFKVYVVLLSGHKSIKAGDYLFNEPNSALKVAYRTIKGIEGLPKIKLTLYEGMSNVEMAAAIKKVIPDFNDAEFLKIAKPHEGRLFPDTYFIYKNTSPKQIIDQLRSNFQEKIKPEMARINAFGKSFEDVIKMASIVEKESKPEDRKIVAGILWKRISMNMPLQVDATFYYVLKKDSLSLTNDDLKINSPYNLYLNTGLPPTPIANPGLGAILDTISPIQTKYLFFLSGSDGKMHYAATHEEHTYNKLKYLR